MTTDLSLLAINTIRTLSIDAIQKANARSDRKARSKSKS